MFQVHYVIKEHFVMLKKLYEYESISIVGFFINFQHKTQHFYQS